MRKINFFVVIAMSVGISSCATIFTGSKGKVVFDSNVQLNHPATLTIDGQKYTNVRFPYTVKVKRGFSDSMAKAEVEGYKPSIISIDKTVEPVTFLNFLSWWFVGFIVDAATGTMMRPEYSSYIFELEPTTLNK